MAKMPSTNAPDKPNTSRQGSLTEMFDSVKDVTSLLHAINEQKR